MSKSPLKRGGPKQQGSDLDSPARHASKKRKLAGELKGDNTKSSEENRKVESNVPVNGATFKTQSSEQSLVTPKEQDVEKKRRKSKAKHKSRVTWEISSGSGGRFLPLDPIFADKEK